MEREQVIKMIEEAMEFNKMVRTKNNAALNEALGLIKKQDGEYERGLNDAWDLARKIAIDPEDGGFSVADLDYIFNAKTPGKIMRTNTSYKEALEKVKAYEKKKEEEAAKPKLGDVVEIFYRDRICSELMAKGIYIKETDETHNILTNGGNLYVIDKDCVASINKTGEHVDIQGMLDKIGD